MSLFDRYQNEAAFRREFVHPFLVRMGFSLVEETHGTRELGQDFVFSELHPVFGYRSYAVVVKHLKGINTGRSVDDVLSQVRQAFNKPIRRLAVPREVYASSVIVINSGAITDNAKEQIWNALQRKVYRENIVFFDGTTANALFAYSQAATAKEKHDSLTAYGNECDFNADMARHAIRDLQSGQARPIFFKYAASEHLMAQVDLLKLCGQQLVYDIWFNFHHIEAASRRVDGFEAIHLPPHLPPIIKDCERAIRLVGDLHDRLIAAIAAVDGKPFMPQQRPPEAV